MVADSNPLPQRLADVYLWRNFATVGARANEYEVCVPFANDAGTLRYAVYGFREYTGGVLHIGRIKEGLVVRNTWHNAGGVVKTGAWSTTTHGAIAGPGTAAFSNTAGDTIATTVSGHTLLVRAYTNVNGGFGVVGIDGDYTAAHRLPIVTAADFKAVTGAANNGGGLCRVTAPGHGLFGGATVIVEGVAGATGVNGAHTVTVVDANTLDLDGSTFGGTYTSGGTLGYFSQADLGLRYLEFYDATGGSNFDESAPLAENLADAPHEITVAHARHGPRRREHRQTLLRGGLRRRSAAPVAHRYGPQFCLPAQRHQYARGRLVFIAGQRDRILARRLQQLSFPGRDPRQRDPKRCAVERRWSLDQLIAG